jgi:hypothetical protein
MLSRPASGASGTGRSARGRRAWRRSRWACRAVPATARTCRSATRSCGGISSSTLICRRTICQASVVSDSSQLDQVVLAPDHGRGRLHALVRQHEGLAGPAQRIAGQAECHGQADRDPVPGQRRGQCRLPSVGDRPGDEDERPRAVQAGQEASPAAGGRLPGSLRGDLRRDGGKNESPEPAPDHGIGAGGGGRGLRGPVRLVVARRRALAGGHAGAGRRAGRRRAGGAELQHAGLPPGVGRALPAWWSRSTSASASVSATPSPSAP